LKSKWNIFLPLIGCIGIVAIVYLQYKPLIVKQKPSVIVSIQKKDPVENIIKIIQKKQPRLDPATIEPIAIAILKYAKEFNFPPELIICIIDRESSFRPILTSKATKNSKLGCWGLMQINPPSHPEKIKKLNIKGKQIYHIDNNIHLGCMILREYYNSTKSINKTLTKYVGGKHNSYVIDILSAYTNLTIEKED